MLINAVNAIMNSCGLILPIAAACIHIALLTWAVVRNIQDGGLMQTKRGRDLIWANCAMAGVLILMGLLMCLYRQRTTVIADLANGGISGKAGWSMYAAEEIYMSLPRNAIRITSMPLYLMGTATVCVYMWIESKYGKRYIPALTAGIAMILYAVSTTTACRWLIIGTGLTAGLSILLLYADYDIAKIRGEGTLLQKDRVCLNDEYAERCGDIKLDKGIQDIPDGFRKTVLSVLEKRKQEYREMQGDIEFCADVYRASIREIRELVIWVSQVLFATGLLIFAIVHESEITQNITAKEISSSVENGTRINAHAITMIDTERLILLGIFSIILFTACLTLLYIFLFNDPVYIPIAEPANGYEPMRVSTARDLLVNSYKKEEKLFQDLAEADSFASFMDTKQMFSVKYDSTYDSETGMMATTAYVTPAPNHVQFIVLSEDNEQLRYIQTKTVTDPDTLSKDFPMHPGAIRKRMIHMTAYPEYSFLKKEGILDYRDGIIGDFAGEVDDAYRELLLASLERATSSIPSSIYELGTRSITKSSLKGYLRSGLDRQDSKVRMLMRSALTGEGLGDDREV